MSQSRKSNKQTEASSRSESGYWSFSFTYLFQNVFEKNLWVTFWKNGHPASLHAAEN